MKDKKIVGIMKFEDYYPFKFAQLENCQQVRVFDELKMNRIEMDMIFKCKEDTFEKRNRQFFEEYQCAIKQEKRQGVTTETIDLSDLWKMTGLIKKNKIIIIKNLDSSIESLDKVKELIVAKTNIEVDELKNFYILIGEKKTLHLVDSWVRDAKFANFKEIEVIELSCE